MEYKEINEKDNLHSESPIYSADSQTYDLFSKAEDNLNLIVNFLSKRIKEKEILDFGCGTGKFIQELAPFSKSYTGVDISESQLEIAKEKSEGHNNVKLIKSFPNKIPLKSNTMDLIFSAWVIGGIHNLETRRSIIKEMRRVVNEKGSIYLIENDIGGEYKKIVEEDYGKEKTKVKLKWLEENGFEKINSFKTYFEFESLESAKKIFKAIFGKEIASKIKTKKIHHNIVIYKNAK